MIENLQHQLREYCEFVRHCLSPGDLHEKNGTVVIGHQTGATTLANPSHTDFDKMALHKNSTGPAF
jgi:hypothetical protein